MRRASFILFASVFALLLSLVFDTTATATNYTITISNANLSQNQTFIFDETNIGPGFSQTYNIHVNNQSSVPVMFGINGFQEDPSNSLSLNELDLIFRRDNAILLDLRNDNYVLKDSFFCIGSGSSSLLTLELYFDANFGNEYQDRSFLIDIIFRADESECNHKGKTVDPPSPPLLPNTGEDRYLYYFLLGSVVLFAITTIVLLVIFIIAKKRNDEDKKREKSPV